MSRSPLVGVALVAALAALGCDKKKDGAAGPDPDAELKSVEAKAAELQAKVPAELRSKLELKASFMERKKGIMVAPSGWSESKVIPGMFEGPDGLGTGTRYSVGTNCDGMCEPKDWAAVVEKVDFGQFKRDGFKVLRDEKGDGVRLMVVEHDGGIEVRWATWKEGARVYFHCSATLKDEAKKAVDAIAGACQATKPIDWK